MAAKTFDEYWKETASYNSINKVGCESVWKAANESLKEKIAAIVIDYQCDLNKNGFVEHDYYIKRLQELTE